jgi:hypothetical protein
MLKMNKSIQMMVILLVLSLSLAFAADIVARMDLDNYPGIFISNQRLDVLFIVGEFAMSEDVISLADIAASLQENLKDEISRSKTQNGSNLFEIDIKGNPKEELTALYMDVFNKKKNSVASTMLDTSLDKMDILDRNLIIVGGPCVNWVSAYFMDHPESCTEGFSPGRGNILLFRNGKGIALVVAGYSAEDTRRAANILANYKDYSSNLFGTSLRVSSAWITDVSIN